MASVDTIDLDWEPEVDDPDDALNYEVYVAVDALGFFRGKECDWTMHLIEAKRYFSKEKEEMMNIFPDDVKFIKL